MNEVRDQYESYPYPERNPKDEKKRLILGSPSLPQEIDHYVFGGQRDWSKPLRILVAGGGTGDGLIQLTALLTQYGKPYDATYIDLSSASRKVAEARAKVRGLKNITFVTGSLLDAPKYGPFDYIDCCGVLHHLPKPDEGFAALRKALAPGGGMGFMVYAPYGRSGVYPLQEAFMALTIGQLPKDRLKAAKKLYERIPEGHPFKSNPNLNDHKNGDAGFFDLLLHSTDRAYDVGTLAAALARNKWSFSGFTVPILYDLARYTEVPDGFDDITSMAIAEKLNGTIRTHTGYATDAPRPIASGKNRALVPHVKGLAAAQLAQAIAQGQAPALDTDGIKGKLTLPKASAPLLSAIDGRRSLQDIATALRMDPITFGGLWTQVEKALLPWGMLVYSNVLR